MLKQILIALSVFSMLVGLGPRAACAQNDLAENAIKSRLIRAGVKTTWRVETRGGATFKGRIVEINTADFVLMDRKSGTRSTIAFADVVQIKKSGLSKLAAIGIAGAVIAGVAATVFAVGIKNLDNEVFR